jgi:hypothetical protein
MIKACSSVVLAGSDITPFSAEKTDYSNLENYKSSIRYLQFLLYTKEIYIFTYLAQQAHCIPVATCCSMIMQILS